MLAPGALCTTSPSPRCRCVTRTRLYVEKNVMKWRLGIDIIGCMLLQAVAARDALAKALYARTFDYLIARLNKAMSVKV